MASIFDKKNWERIGSKKDNQVLNVWQGAISIKEASNIKEFADWISNRQAIGNQTIM
jgi:hypothetical protein